MIISGRFWRKTIVTAIAAVGFVSLYEVTALDSKYAARLATLHETVGAADARLAPRVQRHRLLQGHRRPRPACAAQSGVAAADPELLPVGSVIEIDSLPQKYNGIYTVMDTGPARAGPAGRRLHVELQRGAGSSAASRFT